MTNARIVETFLEETLARTDVPGRLRKLVVCHVIKGNKLGEEVRAVAVPDEPSEEWRTQVAQKIAENVADEAIALASGVQRYAVQALFEGDDKPHGRVIVTAAGKDDEDAISTEGPDEAGLVSAAQRHTEFFAAAFGRLSVGATRSLQELVDKLTKENEQLRSERLKSIRVFEELQTARHEREIEMVREASKAKAFDSTVEKFGMLLPIAINKMAGRQLLPENAPERMMVQAFAQRLTPDKLQRLATSGAFDEAELVAFLNIIQSLAGAKLADAPAPAPTVEHQNGVSP